MISAARCSFFDVTLGAADSPDPLKETKDISGGDGSCPVLGGDTENEAVRRSVTFYSQVTSDWPALKHYYSYVGVRHLL